MAMAPTPATTSTRCLSGFCQENVASVNSIRPFTRMNTIGSTALICQFKRTRLTAGSSSSGFAPAMSAGKTSGIGMQSGQQVRHAEEGEHHDGEAKDGEV